MSWLMAAWQTRSWACLKLSMLLGPLGAQRSESRITLKLSTVFHPWHDQHLRQSRSSPTSLKHEGKQRRGCKSITIADGLTTKLELDLQFFLLKPNLFSCCLGQGSRSCCRPLYAAHERSCMQSEFLWLLLLILIFPLFHTYLYTHRSHMNYFPLGQSSNVREKYLFWMDYCVQILL